MFRTLLFIPGNNKRFIEKAKSLNADINVFVRINSYESGLAGTDLDAIVCDEIDGVVAPKVNNTEEVTHLACRLNELERQNEMNKKMGIMASIESAQGLVNSYSIATADLRVKMLVFGVFDFLNDMGLEYIPDGIEYSFARAKIPIDARAAGVGAIDAIWQKVDDLEGLVHDAETANRL